MRPSPLLRPFVASYADFDMAGWPPARHRGLPDGTLELVVSVGAPLTVRRAGHPDVVAAATVAGLRSGPVGILHDGRQRGVQLALTPRGSRALLGLPAAALAEGVWPLEDIVGRRCHELTDRLADALDAAGRAAALDAVLTSWAVEQDYPRVVDAAWRGLALSAGRVPVSMIAEQVGLGRPHLGQLVRAELGLTPKTVARIFRFGRELQNRLCGEYGFAPVDAYELLGAVATVTINQCVPQWWKSVYTGIDRRFLPPPELHGTGAQAAGGEHATA